MVVFDGSLVKNVSTISSLDFTDKIPVEEKLSPHVYNIMWHVMMIQQWQTGKS